MNKPAEHVFEYRIKVAPQDIDDLGHVNNIVYLRWVQEAASAHWSQLSNETINQKYVWVVKRHEIDYLWPALPQQQLLICTWVGKNEGASSERHTQVYDAATGKKLAEAVTTWCLLDAVSRRPKRIEQEVLDLFEGKA